MKILILLTRLINAEAIMQHKQSCDAQSISSLFHVSSVISSYVISLSSQVSRCFLKVALNGCPLLNHNSGIHQDLTQVNTKVNRKPQLPHYGQPAIPALAWHGVPASGSCPKRGSL